MLELVEAHPPGGLERVRSRIFIQPALTKQPVGIELRRGRSSDIPLCRNADIAPSLTELSIGGRHKTIGGISRLAGGIYCRLLIRQFNVVSRRNADVACACADELACRKRDIALACCDRERVRPSRIRTSHQQPYFYNLDQY